ncbi:MAG: invasion associated locus B family protein [Pseudomonadota bacterium]
MKMTDTAGRIATLVAASFLVAGTALAQDADTEIGADATPEATLDTTPQPVANNSSFGNWIVTCQAVTTRDTACRLVQEQSLTETNQLVARFIALPAEKDAAILLAQVPMGAYLPGGAVYRIADRDDLEQRSMIWQRCLGQLCEAAIKLEADEIATMADGGAILFGYRMDAGADPIILRVETAAFADGVAAIRPQLSN